MWEVTKSFNIAVAHYLPNYPGKCQRLHGHNLEISVTLMGDVLNTQDVLVDFSYLKRILEEQISDKLDHTLLNDLFSMPTVENLSKFVYERITKFFAKNFGNSILVKEVAIKESESSIVKYYDLSKTYSFLNSLPLVKERGEEDVICS